MKKKFEKNGVALTVKVENGLAVRFEVSACENKETFELNTELPYDNKQAELAERVCEAFDDFGNVEMAFAVLDHEITLSEVNNLEEVLKLFLNKEDGLPSWQEYRGLEELGRELFYKKFFEKMPESVFDGIMENINYQMNWHDYAVENMEDVYGICQFDRNSDTYYTKRW